MTPVPTFDALTIDVGGVFVVPDHTRLAAAFSAAGITVDRDRFWEGHYLAMHAVDEARSPAETFGTYVPGFCRHIGLRDKAFEAGVAALDPLFGPSGLWSEPIPEAIADMADLHDAGVPMAIVSNADGTVADILRDAKVCQTGDGPLTPVVAIVDSGAVGVAKPDPRIFDFALRSLGTDPARTLHVGDSVHYDITGARAAGLAAVHFDPRSLCRATDHAHISRLADLLDLAG